MAWLLPHGLGGALALFIGPMQFSARVRERFPKVHRMLGRFYVAGVAVGAPLGIALAFVHHLPLALRDGTPAGYFTLAKTDTVSMGDSYTGTFDYKQYDVQGNLQLEVTGTQGRLASMV